MSREDLLARLRESLAANDPATDRAFYVLVASSAD